MKNLIKIYENLEDETKRMIPLLYMYNEIKNALKTSEIRSKSSKMLLFW